MWCSRAVELGFRRSEMTTPISAASTAMKKSDPPYGCTPATWRSNDLPTWWETVASLLTDFAIVGWFQGRMECGTARARPSVNPGKSDARRPETSSTPGVKFREMFRPFAPIVPLEAAPRILRSGPLKSVHASGRVGASAPTEHDPVRDACGRIGAEFRRSRPDKSEMHRLLLAIEKTQWSAGAAEHQLQYPRRHHRSDARRRPPLLLTTGMDALAIGPYLLRKGPSLMTRAHSGAPEPQAPGRETDGVRRSSQRATIPVS